MSLKNKYVSEIDEFLENFRNENLELKKKQKLNRATWWDKNLYDYDNSIEDMKNSLNKEAYSYL